MANTDEMGLESGFVLCFPDVCWKSFPLGGSSRRESPVPRITEPGLGDGALGSQY